MPPVVYTLIKDLGLHQQYYTIKVRIIKLWKQHEAFIPFETISLHMILTDEEGTKIQAHVQKMLFPYFQEFLCFAHEGLAVYIKQSTVTENHARFFIVDNLLKIIFNNNTEIEQCIQFSGPTNAFKFVEFNSIFSHSLQPNLSIDVIGDLLMCGPVQPEHRNRRMNIQIKDLQGKFINVTLWNSFADQMDKFIANQVPGIRVIVILQFASLTYIRGRPMVSTYFGVSKLFCNNDIEEIKEFQYKLEVQELQEKFGKVLKHSTTD